MKIVLDTDALVSGFLSPIGPPAAILRSVLTELVTVCFDERILSEYRDVLTRGRFDFDRESVDRVLDFIESIGEPTLAGPLKLRLPDPATEMFVEVALASAADFLVTGNAKHFARRRGIRTATPRELLDRLLAE